MTEAELVAALMTAAEERAAATHAIETASDRREALLLEPNSDAAIEKIERSVSRANLSLERLERIEPELEYRLSHVRDRAKIALWLEVRNGYIAAGMAHAEKLRKAASLLDAAAYNTAFNHVVASFPDAAGQLPRFPVLAIKVADDLVEALRRLEWVHFDANPARRAPVLQSSADAEDAASYAAFGEPIVPRAVARCRIRLKVARQIEGSWHPAHAEIEVPRALAEREISSASAVLVVDGGEPNAHDR